MSESLAHCCYSRLLSADPQRFSVHSQALRELLEHGVPYIFAAHAGPFGRGIITGVSAPPLSQTLGNEPAYVWPAADGEVWGTTIEPLYAGAPAAAQRDNRLYELLALVDALRLGRPRERVLASRLLKEYIPLPNAHHAQSGT
ncbi:MAG: hypothetical protein ACRYG7_15845 [Janthinobacterium lividum]